MRAPQADGQEGKRSPIENSYAGAMVEAEPPVSSRTDPTVATSRAGMARLPGGSVPMLLGVDYWRISRH